MHPEFDLHRNRQLRFCLAIAVGLLLAPAHATAQVGLGLSPMRLELRLAPGASYSGTLRLYNEGDLTRARASVLDFHIDDQQVPQFEPSLTEEAAYSCRSWVTVNPMEAELNLRAALPVRYTLRVPAGAEPRSYYCAVGFTSLPPATDTGRLGIRTAVRVVAAFYVIVGDPPIEGRLSAISIENIPASENVRAVVVLENSGRMFYRPKGTLAVSDPSGALIESHDLTSLPVLPERKQRFLIPLQKITAGQPCVLRVRVELGTREIQEGTAVVQAASVP